MERMLLLLACIFLPACTWVRLHRHPDHARPEERELPAHAPPAEAAQVKFPAQFPKEGLHELPGVMATAIQLAMDDFRPPGSKPHPGATPLEQCLYRRQSFDVMAVPGPAGVVFVRFVFNPDACTEEERAVVLDMGATYAIDVRQWRILAVQP